MADDTDTVANLGPMTGVVRPHTLESCNRCHLVLAQESMSMFVVNDSAVWLCPECSECSRGS